MNLFDDEDCLDYARRFARKAYNKYILITNCERLTYDDILDESVLCIWQLRSKNNIEDTSDCGAYVWTALKRRFYRLIDSTSIVKMPDYQSKSYNKELAGYYVAGNELSIDSLVGDSDDTDYEGYINNGVSFEDDVITSVVVAEISAKLSPEDRLELELWLEGQKPKSRKRRETLIPRCREIFEGRCPYKAINQNKYPGVEERPGNRWRAYKVINRKKKILGTFGTPEEAYEAVLAFTG